MLKTKSIILLSFVLLAVIIIGCTEKKDTAQTSNKASDNQTTKTDTIKTSQTQTTEKKDTSMQNNQTTSKDQKNDQTTKDSDKAGGNIVKMETTVGTIKINLFTDKAPITAGNFKKLVEQGFYNGLIFHRVIDGFMIQGGDPTGTGTSGSKETIQDEFGAGLKHSKKGILSMANRGPNTGTSQFFITLAPTPHLDGKHAIFGEVVEGMDIVEKIGKVKTGPGDKPAIDVKITKASMVEK